jgi:hypothetical protein
VVCLFYLARNDNVLAAELNFRSRDLNLVALGDGEVVDAKECGRTEMNSQNI